MRITSLETVPYALPFHRTYASAAGRLDRRESLLVRLRTDGQEVGLGEAVPLSMRGGESLAVVRRQLDDRLAPILTGAEIPAHPEAANAAMGELLDRCRGSGAGRTALCGADIALHDLAGKATGLPVAELIGVRELGPVPCNGTIGAVEAPAAADAAERLLLAGFGSVKVKVGVGDDVARIAAVREVTETRASIRVDANGAWSANRALRMDLVLSPLELLEQPCRDLESLARVRAGTTTPVVADESVASATEAERALALAACDATTAKLSKVGGIRETMRIAELVPTYLSSALDGPVGVVAAAHCANAIPATRYAHGLATGSLFSAAPAPWPEIEDGSMLLPTGPGLGIEIDEDALAALAIG